MKKVISIALFGVNHEKYAQFLPAFVLAHANLFPLSESWILRVHIDDAVAEGRWGRFLEALADSDLAEFQILDDAPLTKSMLWRLAPVFDKDVDYVFCRDVDSLPTPRDRLVCEQFIRSVCTINTVADSVSHIGMMGGLCGFHAASFRSTTRFQSLNDVYAFAKQTDEAWAKHGTDQIVLNRMLVAFPFLTLLEHRYNGWGAGEPGKSSPREAGHYPCRAWSTPTPDSGVSKLLPAIAAEADRIGQHLGSAGFDIARAMKFWQDHGDSRIAKAVEECRREACDA